ncbi:cytochrome P450 [Haliea sp. E17]|uniref:cytochrome P450 n=1 Tax=Haliea sp. E17 TaxID=3401576 RepID=UPI003AAD49B2
MTRTSNDPAHFDRPRKFDIERANASDRVVFSKGRHACIGAPLGALESRIAIERFLARTRDLSLDDLHHGGEENRHFQRVVGRQEQEVGIHYLAGMVIPQIQLLMPGGIRVIVYQQPTHRAGTRRRA